MAATKGQPGTKPSQLSNPVPGADAASAFDAYLAQNNAPQSAPAASAVGLAAESEDQYAPVETAQAQGELPPEEPGMGMQALDAAGRVLDYGGGLMRTGLASVASTAQHALKGELGNDVTPADVKAAFKGKAPETAEYLRRMGVPEGGSVEVPGLGRVTTRGAVGLAGDIASDPLTAVAKLAKSAPYLKKLLEVPGRATEAVGEAIYRSGLSKIDAKLAERGAGKLSGALIEAGAPVGTTAQIAKKVEAMSQTIGKVRQGLYDKATELGVTIDTAYPLKRAEAVMKKFKNDPGLAPAMSELQGLVDRYKAAGKVSIDELSAWKTHLYDSLPASAFDGYGKIKGQAKTLKSALAADFREAIVGAGNKAEKGLGDAINTLNEKWGTLLEAQKPLAKQAAGAGIGGGKLGTMIDGMLLGSGNGWAFVGKKALEGMNTTAVKSTAGKAAMELGKLDFMNRLTRQAIAETGRPSPVPDPVPEE